MVLKDAKFFFLHYLYLAFFVAIIFRLVPEKLAENHEFMVLLIFNFLCLGIYLFNKMEDVMDSHDNLSDYLDERLSPLLTEILILPLRIYTGVFPYFFGFCTLAYGVVLLSHFT